jgi:hypothetical protein
LRPLDEIGRKLFAVELRHPIAGLRPQASPPAQRATHQPLRRRVLAWVFSWRIDEALADGADPDRDPLTATRAEQLLSTHTRRRLADSLRDAVERAARPAPASACAPLATAAVRANSGLLLALAARLDSERPVGVCGVARAQLLVTDGASELYAPGNGLPLEGAVEAALIGLGS